MNIFMIGTFPPFRGGISHFNTILYRTLSKNYPVKAINFTTQYPDFLFPGKTQIEESSIVSDVSSLRLLSSVNPYSWIKTGKRIAEQKANLVIFKYWMPFFAPAFGTVVRILKHKLNTKVLIICDNIIPHETHWYDMILTRYFFNVVDFFVVMSKSVENDLLKLYPDATYRYSPHPIYDIFGNLHKNIVNEYKQKGNYFFEFYGNKLKNGIYLCTMKTENYESTKKNLIFN